MTVLLRAADSFPMKQHTVKCPKIIFVLISLHLGTYKGKSIDLLVRTSLAGAVCGLRERRPARPAGARAPGCGCCAPRPEWATPLGSPADLLHWPLLGPAGLSLFPKTPRGLGIPRSHHPLPVGHQTAPGSFPGHSSFSMVTGQACPLWVSL